MHDQADARTASWRDKPCDVCGEARRITPMADLQNAVTGNKAGFEPDADGLYLRPQILHYLSGGGHFASHVHPYLPQRIGLIVAMSQRGRDYGTGGACFEFDGQVIDLEGRHDIGDIALFRYDVTHCIKATDPDAPLDWASPRGRWTMTLPHSSPATAPFLTRPADGADAAGSA